jgi:endo-1,3-1,4-beta-glycanase ExoK
MKRILFAAAVAVAASVASAANVPPIERFARLDSARWIVSDGWSNGDWQVNDWRRSQISTGSSGMIVALDKNPAAKNGYSSGEIQSRNTYQYGYFETRMRAAPGSGMVSGFFTYIGPPQGHPWNEVDVEILGKNTRAVSFTYHTGKDQHATVVDLPFDSAAESHAYGFDWQPQYIRWYVDGKLVHEDSGSALPLPTEPQKIFFDMWGSNSTPDWTGKFAWPGHPITARVSCIAMAQHFTGSILC